MQWHKKESFTNPKGNLTSLLAASMNRQLKIDTIPAELAFLNHYQEEFHKPKKPMHKKISSKLASRPCFLVANARAF
jgi:hypothetical protein